jgi:DNA-binding NarL/FixJ family response regulator
MSRMTRILISDDQRIFAEGLQYVIESRASDMKVVDIAANGQEALEKVRELEPDVVLMDVRMPVMDGVDATRRIHEEFPHIRILILTTFDDDEYVTYSLRNGAIGYLLKNRPPDELIDSIRALGKGILQIDPAVSSTLFQVSKESDADAQGIEARLGTLTGREREVLRLLVDANRIRQISQKLAIAEQTVRNHIGNIYSKLDIHNRMEIVRFINQIRAFLERDE